MKEHVRQRERMRRRRRRRMSLYPLQLTAAAAVVALSGWLIVLFCMKAAHPYWLGHSVNRKVALLQTELSERKARNTALRAQVRYLQSPEGTETIARRAGWRRDGEQVYYLREPAAAAVRRQ